MKYLIILIIPILSLIACGPKSKKGAWIDEDKKKFSDSCNIKVDAKLGKTAKLLGLDTQKMCDCMTKKMEAEYDNYETMNAQKGEEAKKHAEEIMTPCVQEAMKNVNPN